MHTIYVIALLNYLEYSYSIYKYLNNTVVLVERLKSPGRSKGECPKRSRKESIPTSDVDISEDNDNNIEDKEKGLFHCVLEIYILNKRNKFITGIIQTNLCYEFLYGIFTHLNLL